MQFRMLRVRATILLGRKKGRKERKPDPRADPLRAVQGRAPRCCGNRIFKGNIVRVPAVLRD